MQSNNRTTEPCRSLGHGSGLFYQQAQHGVLHIENIQFECALTKLLIRLFQTESRNGMVGKDVLEAYQLLKRIFPNVPALFSMHGGSWRDRDEPHYHVIVDNNQLFRHFMSSKTEQNSYTQHLLHILSHKIDPLHICTYPDAQGDVLGTQAGLIFQKKETMLKGKKNLFTILHETTGFALDGYKQSVFWFSRLDNGNQTFQVDCDMFGPKIQPDTPYVLAPYSKLLETRFRNSVVVYNIENMKLSTSLSFDVKQQKLAVAKSRAGGKQFPKLLLIKKVDLIVDSRPVVTEVPRKEWSEVRISPKDCLNRYFQHDLKESQDALLQLRLQEQNEHTPFSETFKGLALRPHPYLPMLLFGCSTQIEEESAKQESSELDELMQNLTLDVRSNPEETLPWISDVLELVQSMSISTYHLVLATPTYSFEWSEQKQFLPSECTFEVGFVAKGYILMEPKKFLLHCENAEAWLLQYEQKGNFAIFT